MERGVDAATAAAWAAVGGDAALAAGVSFRGAGGVLPAVLPVREAARASVGACSLAAAELWAVRNGGAVPGVRVDEGAVAAAFVSERHLRVEGRSGGSFAPLSGFWEAADGWVRTHANYPHHRARLLEALGVGGLPAAGVRVLDLTRVIAGPVATRTLALSGADVLRVDAPGSVEDVFGHVDTGVGKRSALVDLGSAGGRAVFEGLLESADVVVAGYRPGALERLGLGTEELMARRPGLVVARLCAWGWSGPWSGRRGFDSLVQAASGIAAVESGGGGRPGVLPAQALDHGTGYLVAAGVLRALADREGDGRGREVRLSLAGTARWLLRGVEGAPVGEGVFEPGAWMAGRVTPYGRVRYVLSPLGVVGGPVDWACGPGVWGGDRAVWVSGV
ncbi:CoA transferase [Nocardiopsis suaedae]|uniref:CoA transferase n=1 Tax=Nocardiopsis suaedae TaxID=3018444 RepID=A0ABT4TVX1_9ACTN|nr:CoA transferase [Nocardiopsis suaedae]MDA2808399.1 CoA transferase [Nocardiopsis suaedae]